MTLDGMVNIIVFVFGLLAGSFLNVVVLRTEKEEDMIWTPSYCPSCKKKLAWYELFPLVSYLLQGGKCRGCKRSISMQYFLVETATGLGFLLIWALLSSTYVMGGRLLIEMLFWVVLYSFFVIIFVYDLRNKIIPDEYLFPAMFVSFFYALQRDIFSGCLASAHSYVVLGVIASAGAAVFFWSIYYFSRGTWMGFGDVKLVMLLGFLLGPRDTFVGLMLAFFLGSVVGVLLMVFSGLKIKSEIPFGPFLIAGAFIAFFYGTALSGWYLHVMNEINIYLLYGVS
jgi:prepilin signal peptidase PulO-like enzyme (type II secretory pathway)